MNKKIFLIFEILMTASLIGLNVAFLNNHAMGTILLKSTASLFFVLTGFCGYIKSKDNRTFSRLLLIGLICCMAGDVFLALDSSGILFVIGVACFAATHVLYSVAFCKVSPIKKEDISAMLVLFTVLALILCLGNFDFQGLFPVLLIYSAIISVMVVKALSLRRCNKGEVPGIKLIMSSGVVFLMSDIVLLFYLFGIGVSKEIQSVNWVLYYTAQGLLTFALNMDVEKNPPL